MKCLLSMDSTELVRKVIEAQKQDPTSGDFIKLVEKVMVDFNVTWELGEDISKDDLKKLVKTNATNLVLNALEGIQMKH